LDGTDGSGNNRLLVDRQINRLEAGRCPCVRSHDGVLILRSAIRPGESGRRCRFSRPSGQHVSSARYLLSLRAASAAYNCAEVDGAMPATGGILKLDVSRQHGESSMRICTSVLFAVVGLLLAAEASYAEPWVAKMFAEEEHDFGTVARGADVVYRFEAKNIYKQDVRLVSVRSSCGCTSAAIEGDTLKTGEVGYVVATFNTRTFTGQHGATLTVTVLWDDGGTKRQGETQLRVRGNIRGDVVFQPGAVGFADIAQGEMVERKVRVTYAGHADWRILDVRGVATDVEAELTETQRTAGHVAYDLLVRLKDSAPAGYFHEQLVLVTSDGQNPRIPLDVSGRVISPISVSPESLLLGDVAHGEQVSKKVIVRGQQPFRIVSIDCDRQCFQFNADDESSPRHVVEVVFDAKDVGTVKQAINVTTDLGDHYRATLTAYATVVPAEEPDATAASAASSAVSPVSTQ
jgi:hypothetical protein